MQAKTTDLITGMKTLAQYAKLLCFPGLEIPYKANQPVTALWWFLSGDIIGSSTLFVLTKAVCLGQVSRNYCY